MTSRFSDFYKLTPKERLSYLESFAKLSGEEVRLLSSSGGLGVELVDRMVENVIGVLPVPLGLASGFIVNGKEYLVPMATEQRSVISMATRGAEWTQATGGFKARSTGSTTIGQIQLAKMQDFEKVKQRILNNKEEILYEANTRSRTRRALDVEVRTVETSVGPMLVVELLVDAKDSMGANIVNSMCEAASPLVESLTDGKVSLRTVSNLATRRLVHVEAVVAKNAFEEVETVDRIVEATRVLTLKGFEIIFHPIGTGYTTKPI